MPTKKGRAAHGVLSPDRMQTPGFVVPMAAMPVETLPEGPAWLYELKLDGYRALIIKDGASIKIRSRNDKDLMRMSPAIATACRRLATELAVIDGEIVALDKQGARLSRRYNIAALIPITPLCSMHSIFCTLTVRT